MKNCRRKSTNWLRGGMLAVLALSLLAGRAQAAPDPEKMGPANVMVTPGSAKLTVSWDSPDWEAVGYQVQWREVADPEKDWEPHDVTGPSVTEYVIDGLGGDKTYQVRVFAKDENDDYYFTPYGTAGDPPIYTGIQPYPGQVQNVMLTSGSAKLTVSWDKVAGATQYIVEWKSGVQKYKEESATSSSRHRVKLDEDPEPDRYEYEISDDSATDDDDDPLRGDTEYTVRVTALNDEYGPAAADDVYGTSSEEEMATPAPAQVMNVTVKSKPNTLEVSWDPVDGTTTYQVEWKTGTQRYDQARRQETDAPETSLTIDEPLSAASQYTVQVRAINSHGNGDFSEENFANLPAPGQVMPASVSVNSEMANQLTVRWTAVPGARRYKVQWKSEMEYEADGDREKTTSGSETELTIGDNVALSADTEYTVRVIATNKHDHDSNSGTDDIGGDGTESHEDEDGVSRNADSGPGGTPS